MIKTEAMKLSDLRQIAQRMAKARLDELVLCHHGVSVRMRFAPQDIVFSAPSVPVDVVADLSVAEANRTEMITASAPGQFLSRHPGHTQNYIAIGSLVKVGDLVGTLRMGEFYLPLYSSVSGKVTEIITTEDYVEYGQPVVFIERAE